MSRFLRLHAEGLRQSWAEDGIGFTKGTSAFPTRSGVVGMLAAALGLLRTDPRVDQLHRTCRVSSRVLREGDTLVEYQNMRDWDIRETRPEKSRPSVLDFVAAQQPPDEIQRAWRAYHVDAAFQVVVEVLDGCPFSAEEILAAARRPAFPLYLGRKYCRLSYPLAGATDEVVEAASPAEVFGPVSAHVRALRDEPYGEDGFEGDRYADATTTVASLDLPPGAPRPTTGHVLPVRVGDVVTSNRTRAFSSRVQLVWTKEGAPC